MGLKFLGSVRLPFLYWGLSLAILECWENVDKNIDRLHSWLIGKARTLAPSLRNFPDRLPIPEALFGEKLVSYLCISSSEVWVTLKLLVDR